LIAAKKNEYDIRMLEIMRPRLILVIAAVSPPN
jgi:hypothetical protein